MQSSVRVALLLYRRTGPELMPKIQSPAPHIRNNKMPEGRSAKALPNTKMYCMKQVYRKRIRCNPQRRVKSWIAPPRPCSRSRSPEATGIAGHLRIIKNTLEGGSICHVGRWAQPIASLQVESRVVGQQGSPSSAALSSPVVREQCG